MGNTTGGDPVSPVTASTRLTRVKHTIDIYQDQRGQLLHASTVRGRPITGHTYAWLQSLRRARPRGSGRPGLEHVKVPFGVQPVLPLLAEDGLQASAYGETLRLRVARLHDWLGHAGQLLV